MLPLMLLKSVHALYKSEFQKVTTMKESCGAGAGWGIRYLTQKGKDPKALLNTADTVIDGVKTANDEFGKFLPSPIEFIIDKVLQTAQAGVHAAQQLCDSDQLTEDQRKQKAFDTAMNLLKLEGYQPTPELEAAVKDAIETGVFVMKNIVKPIVVAPVVPVPSDVTAVTEPVAVVADPTVPVPAPDLPPKSITEVIQATIDQVGEQAKTQTVHDLTQQFAEVVRKAVPPVDVTPVA